MQRRLAANGIWVEPASAAGLAGLAHERALGRLELKGKRVVAVCTGHGLKDPQIISQTFPALQVVPAEYRALENAILKGKEA